MLIPIDVLEFCKAWVNREYLHVRLSIITLAMIFINSNINSLWKVLAKTQNFQIFHESKFSIIMKFICSPKLCKICKKINKENGLRKITGTIRSYCEDLWYRPESKCCNLSAAQSAAWNIDQWANPEISAQKFQPDGNWHLKPVTLSSQTTHELFKHIKGSNGVKRRHRQKDFLGALIIVIALILFCFFALLTLSLVLKIRKFLLKKFNGTSIVVVGMSSSMIKRKSIFELN